MRGCGRSNILSVASASLAWAARRSRRSVCGQCYIEITPFDLIKYEVDKASGYLRVRSPAANVVPAAGTLWIRPAYVLRSARRRR